MADDFIVIGNIIHSIEPFSIHTLELGFVLVRGSKILAVDHVSVAEATLEKLKIRADVRRVVLKDSQILIPGLIDTHIHAPQYPNSGLGYDRPLLDWLQTYTYPLEKKFSDADFAEKVYNAVVRKTLAHGTTTALYFGSLYGDTTLILADAAIAQGQRALIGKVNMIKFSFYGYEETREEAIENTIKFVKDILDKNSSLVKPVITPRFVLSVDEPLMKELAKIARQYNLHVQSHISENVDEIAAVHEEYGVSYAEAYDKGELLTNKTVLAHGVHLEEDEIKLLVERGTSISHCPSSNTNLKSGICDVRKLVHHGVSLGLGTDVSGGESPSIITAMRSAIQSSIHVSFGKTDYDPLNFYDAFYLATMGGAKALSLDNEIGNFKQGKEFDALIVDMNVENSSSDYLHECTPVELLEKFIFIGDDRNVVKVYVAGKLVKG